MRLADPNEPLNGSPNASPKASMISVVLPTLNEVRHIAERIAQLRQIGVAEIIVADGGSTDGTVAVCQEADGVTLVTCEPGRGRQIRAGVAASRHAHIIVLHADTRLPPTGCAAVNAALSDPSVCGGSFRLSFDEDGLPFRVYAACSRIESGLTTFGDQAFFFRLADFDAAGGTPDWPLFEDVELRRRLLRRGRFVKLPIAVTTSARRFRAHGPYVTQLINVALVIAFKLGVSPVRLARYYYRKARAEQ
jgi:rSAM/selenodomain-associated transferase 2